VWLWVALATYIGVALDDTAMLRRRTFE